MGRNRVLLAVCPLAVLLSACPDASAPVPSVDAAREGSPSNFWAHGVPGPWSRDGATGAVFEQESGICVERSQNARATVEAESRAARAYEEFLDCMIEHRWSRG